MVNINSDRLMNLNWAVSLFRCKSDIEEYPIGCLVSKLFSGCAKEGDSVGALNKEHL